MIGRAALRILGRVAGGLKGLDGGVVNGNVVRVPVTADIEAGYGETADAVMRSVHSGRPCTPEEVAQTIVWLGTESPAYLSGATIDVNNGSYPR